VTRSGANQLLEEADREPDRLRRHLLVAAALDSTFAKRAVVVGGTAEEYWTHDDYHPTDLDVCMPLSSIVIRRTRQVEPPLGDSMRTLSRRVRTRVRRELTRPE
jgi:hypothetical protein